jgi:hypothetical protein
MITCSFIIQEAILIPFLISVLFDLISSLPTKYAVSFPMYPNPIPQKKEINTTTH